MNEVKQFNVLGVDIPVKDTVARGKIGELNSTINFVNMSPLKGMPFLPQAICEHAGNFYICGTVSGQGFNVYLTDKNFESYTIVGKTKREPESIMFFDGYFYTTEYLPGLVKYDTNFNYIETIPVLENEGVVCVCTDGENVYTLSYNFTDASVAKITTLDRTFSIIDSFIIPTGKNYHTESLSYYNGCLYIGVYYDRETNTRSGLFKVDITTHKASFSSIQGVSKNGELEDMVIENDGTGFVLNYYNIGTRNYCSVYSIDLNSANWGAVVSRGICDYGTVYYVDPSSPRNGNGSKSSPFNDLQIAIDMSSKYARSVVNIIGDYTGSAEFIRISAYSNLVIDGGNHNLNYRFSLTDGCTIRFNNFKCTSLTVDRSTVLYAGTITALTYTAITANYSSVFVTGTVHGSTLIDAGNGSQVYLSITTDCNNLGSLNYSYLIGKIVGKTGSFTGAGGIDNSVKS